MCTFRRNFFKWFFRPWNLHLLVPVWSQIFPYSITSETLNHIDILTIPTFEISSASKYFLQYIRIFNKIQAFPDSTLEAIFVWIHSKATLIISVFQSSKSSASILRHHNEVLQFLPPARSNFSMLYCDLNTWQCWSDKSEWLFLNVSLSRRAIISHFNLIGFSNSWAQSEKESYSQGEGQRWEELQGSKGQRCQELQGSKESYSQGKERRFNQLQGSKGQRWKEL